MSEKEVLEHLKPLEMYFTSPCAMRINPPTTTMKIAISLAPVNRFCVPVARFTL